MRTTFDNEAVGKSDDAYKFSLGAIRCIFPDGKDISVEKTHFDKGLWICTKTALDPALRDPGGRCYWCDIVRDDPKEIGICNMVVYFTNPPSAGMQLVYPPDNPGSYFFTWVKLVGQRLSDIKMMSQQHKDFRFVDVIANCVDPKWQDVNFQAQPVCSWASTPEGQQVFASLYAQLARPAAELEAKLGKHLRTLEEQIDYVTKRDAKQGGASGAAGRAQGMQAPPQTQGGWAGAPGTGMQVAQPPFTGFGGQQAPQAGFGQVGFGQSAQPGAGFGGQQAPLGGGFPTPQSGQPQPGFQPLQPLGGAGMQQAPAGTFPAPGAFAPPVAPAVPAAVAAPAPVTAPAAAPAAGGMNNAELLAELARLQGQVTGQAGQ